MTDVTFHDLLNKYRHLLDDKTYVKVYEFYIDGKSDPEELQDLLFKEESDWYYDSNADKADRSKGKNPMNKDYTDKMNKKRIALGVSPLSSSGYSPDTTSKEFCEAIIKNSPRHTESN